MPDNTAEEIFAFRDLLIQISPTLSVSISEQINRDLQIEPPSVRSIPIQEILARTEMALCTVFSFSAPHSAESVLLFSEETARVFADLIDGKEGGDPPLVLTEAQSEKLSTAMTGVVRGLATGLTNLTGAAIDLEACNTHVGPITLPPSFALSNNAIQAVFALTIPDVQETQMTLLVTPQMVQALVPPVGESSIETESAHGDAGLISSEDLAAMLNDMSSPTTDTILPSESEPSPAAAPFQPLPLSAQENVLPRGMELILDIPLDVTVELGRVRMLIKDVLELSSGSIVELDRVAGEPVDLLVNGRLIAKGEVVVIEDNFGIRITEIISPADRVSSLAKGRK